MRRNPFSRGDGLGVTGVKPSSLGEGGGTITSIGVLAGAFPSLGTGWWRMGMKSSVAECGEPCGLGSGDGTLRCAAGGGAIVTVRKRPGGAILVVVVVVVIDVVFVLLIVTGTVGVW